MRNTIIISIFLALIFYSCTKNESKWEGQWIGLEKEAPNSWICFRKNINIKATPQKATLNIACDSKYWLWINGELAVFEGQLKRGPSPKNTYYDSLNIQPFLQEGENTIALLVWYFGKHGFSHNSSGKAGLVFDAIVDGQRFISDTTWKVKLHPAYGNTGEPFPNYRLSEQNIHFDATKDIPGWEGLGFDDSGWENAKVFGLPPVSPWNKLVLRPIPQWTNSGLLPYVKTTTMISETGERIISAKLPANIQITPYLKIKAHEGVKIDITTDNYYAGGYQPTLRTEYITKEGVQEFESLSWINGHEVLYHIPEGIEIIDLKYRETGYNAEFIGHFSCNDESLNSLYKKAVRTLHITMRDNYMDCPDRERGQWWGDAVNEIGEAFYVFDAKNGPKLARKAMYELMLWQRDDSVIYSPIPSGRVVDKKFYKNNQRSGLWNKELPCQMLASIGWYGFWTYYLYSDDKQTIIDLYPYVKKYLDVWAIGQNGLVKLRTGDWGWFDWGKNIDIPVIENAWYYMALKAAVEMANISGHKNDIPVLKQKMESIEKNYNSQFWTGKEYRSPGYKEETDDRANALAVVAGLAEEEYYPAIREVLKREFHASPYMEKYVDEALFLMNSPEQALTRIKKRWRDNIESPHTTLWENWEFKEHGGEGGGTYNHGWSGGPLTLLCQYVAGIAPIKPGFKEFSVMPQMGDLNHVEVTVPVPDGEINLKLQKGEKAFKMELEVPKGKKALVGIPKSQKFIIHQINILDKTVWENGKTVLNLSGVNYNNEDEKYFYYIFTDGRWIVNIN